MAFAWYSPISINAAQVPSTQTDFPVLVSQTDNRFKTIANSGHVANASGFDIRPYSDSGLTSALSYDLERYNATTGEVVMWVKVGSLSSSTTPIYLAYGDASLSTDGTSTATWSNSFLGVYHLADGTTLNVNSATGSNNGTNFGAAAAAGMIDGGASFIAVNTDSIGCGSSMNPTAVTISAWAKGTTFPGSLNGVVCREGGSSHSTILLVNSSGKLFCYVSATTNLSYNGTGSHTLSTGTWYLLHLSYDSSAGLVGYVNASSDNTVAANGNCVTTATTFTIGADGATAGRYWNGSIDEARFSSVARSADWITTEYNNQSAPATFETLGTEVVGPAGAATGNMFLLFP